MPPRVAFYVRVSTKDQTLDNQHLQLDQWAARAGFADAIAGRYEDHAMSGRREGRPGLRALELAVTRREVNTVVVVALDRIARNLAHLTKLMAEWDALGCKLVSLREAVDTGTPTGRALVQMAGVFAELEASLIAERTRAGLARARAQGRRPGQRPLVKAKRDAMERLLLEGTPEGEIVARLDVGKGTIYRTRQRMLREGLLA